MKKQLLMIVMLFACVTFNSCSVEETVDTSADFELVIEDKSFSNEPVYCGPCECEANGDCFQPTKNVATDDCDDILVDSCPIDDQHKLFVPEGCSGNYANGQYWEVVWDQDTHGWRLRTGGEYLAISQATRDAYCDEQHK